MSLRHYEVMVILDPELDERTVAPSLDTYLNVVKNDGGSVENVDVWGKRRLAYEINKKNEGIYARVRRPHEGHPTRREVRAHPSSLWTVTRSLSAPRGSLVQRSLDRIPPPATTATIERLVPWQARPSSPSSATSPTTPS